MLHDRRRDGLLRMSDAAVPPMSPLVAAPAGRGIRSSVIEP
jgi:hypothetical protein